MEGAAESRARGGGLLRGRRGLQGWGAGCGRPQAESPDPESCGQGRESRYDGGDHPGGSREQHPASDPRPAPHLSAAPLPAMKPHPGAAPPARNDGHSGRGRGDRPALPPPPRARRSRGRSRRTWDPGPSAALRVSRTRRAGPGRPLYMRACGIRGRRRGPCPPNSPACALPSPQSLLDFTLTPWPSNPSTVLQSPRALRELGTLSTPESGQVWSAVKLWATSCAGRRRALVC